MRLDVSEGNSIREAIRSRLGLSQAEFSQNIGIDPPNLSAYLNGTKPLTAETLNIILNGLGLHSTWTIQIEIDVAPEPETPVAALPKD